MRQWRLIYDLPTPGPLNMAVDEALLMLLGGQPVLRLYAWQPGCLSLGYGQRAGDVDAEQARAAGYDLVRRPTGGRAILHADELTYSVVLPADHAIAAGGILPSYQRISSALLAGLQRLGLVLQADEQASRTACGPVCFEVASHYEITAQGRKLVGSAQVRRSGGILQHGSIPLRGDLARICDVLKYPNPAARETAREQVRARAITLSDALGGAPVEWQHAAEALAEGFRATFEVNFAISTLSAAEHRLAAQLVAEKYAQPAWTFRR